MGPVSLAPMELQESSSAADLARDTPWITIVWNDPINLMSYVTFVFMNYFGYPRAKAETLMLDVHKKGRAVVSAGSREEMERDATAMHSYGLWATVSRDD
jgi:ATP-dependent Clp protease adaptor protein ClpS